MKNKFARILGVGVTLALLASLLVSAIPAAALSQPQVALEAYRNVISYDCDYTITFTAGVAVGNTDTGRIVITLPTGTDATTISNVSIQALTGIGGGPIGPLTPMYTLPATTTEAQIVIIDLPAPGLGAGSLVGITLYDVTNPASAGSYTLTVATEKEIAPDTWVPVEAAVTSAAYKIEVPTIAPLPGIVSVYNPNGILMAQYTGERAIQYGIDLVSGDNWTVQVGPGTYEWDWLVIDQDVAYLTIKGTGATADLAVVKCTDDVVHIFDSYVTLDNLTFDCTDNGVYANIDGDNFTIKNCIFKNGNTAHGELWINGATPGTVDTCIFDVTGTAYEGIEAYSAVTVKNCTFSVDADGLAIYAEEDVSVSNCTVTGASGTGIVFDDSTYGSTVDTCTFKTLNAAIVVGAEVTVKNSTIEACGASTAGDGDAIMVSGIDSLLFMYGTTIKDTNAKNYALSIDTGMVYAWFNNFTGNTLNIENVAGTVDARHNWWGDTTGPATTSISGTVTTSPVAGASISTAAAALDEDVLDASTTVGVSVTALADNSLVEVDAIAIAKYSGNPQTVAAPIVGTGSVLGYYDVFFINQPVITAKPKTYGAVTSIGTGTPQTESYNGVLLPCADTLQIKFFGAVTSYTKVYYGGALSGAWAEPTGSSGVNVPGGYAYVTVTGTSAPSLVDLTGTPFAVVDDKTTAPPALGTPKVGEYGISITPTYTWDKVPGAIRYEIALSEDPTFAIVEWSYNCTNNFYKDTEDLKYNTTYYWRVRGVLAEPYLSGPTWVTPATPWATGIFTTEAEPVAEEPQEITVPPAEVTVSVPPTKVTVESPGPFIPEYILWVIVGVGAVLIIALIILIVRTRRAV